jgi:hypothetical protein
MGASRSGWPRMPGAWQGQDGPFGHGYHPTGSGIWTASPARVERTCAGPPTGEPDGGGETGTCGRPEVWLALSVNDLITSLRREGPVEFPVEDALATCCYSGSP